MAKDIGSDKAFTVEECTVHKDGHCAMHGVEIERRKTDRRTLNQHSEEIKELQEASHDYETFKATTSDSLADLEKNALIHKGHIGELLTFKNIAYGISAFGALFFLGNYIYTFTTKVELESEIARMRTEIEAKCQQTKSDVDRNHNSIVILSNKMTELSTRSDERQTAWMEKWDVTNTRLSQLVNIIDEERRAKRVTRVRLEEQEKEDRGVDY